MGVCVCMYEYSGGSDDSSLPPPFEKCLWVCGCGSSLPPPCESVFLDTNKKLSLPQGIITPTTIFIHTHTHTHTHTFIPPTTILIHTHTSLLVSKKTDLSGVFVGVWVWVYMYEESECGRTCMGWLRLVGSFKLQVSFAEYSLFYRDLLQKRPIILRNLLVEATPYEDSHSENDAYTLTHTHPHHSHHNPHTYTHTLTRSHLQIGWYGILRFFLKKFN